MEQIIGTIRKVSSHSYDVLYDLYFTTERVVAILMQSPGDVQPAVSPWTFFIGSGFVRHKEHQERQKIVQERQHQSNTLTLDELISINPDNFEIRYSTIDSVEIKNRLFEYHLIFQISATSGNKAKKDFTLKKDQVTEAGLLLEKVLSSKFRQE